MIYFAVESVPKCQIDALTKKQKHMKLGQMRTKCGICSVREKLGKFFTHWTGEASSKARAVKLERHFTLEPHYSGVSSHRRLTHGNRRWMAPVSSLQPVFCSDAERSNSLWMNRIFKTIRRVMTITRYFCLNKSYDSESSLPLCCEWWSNGNDHLLLKQSHWK